MRLAIDLDGVVADFNAGWIRRYNEDFAMEIPSDAVTAWDGLHELTHFPSMSAFWRWAHRGEEASIFRHLDVYDGALDALTVLYRRHSIIIVTSKPEWAIWDTFEWIAEHRIPTREVHIVEEKWRVDADLYLDDAPKQLESLRNMRPEATICRMVRPWNDAVPGTVDVHDWSEFVSIVDGL